MSGSHNDMLSEIIEKGHTRLDELHQLLMDLKDQNVNEITELKGQLEQNNQKLKAVEEQRDAAAKALNANMCVVVDLREKARQHQEEIQKRDNQIMIWKNKYNQLQQNLRNLTTDSGSEEDEEVWEAGSENEDGNNKENTSVVEETGETKAKRFRSDK